MRWVIVTVAAVILVALVATQLAIPPIASNQIENRLTDDGGSASATVKALPALRLLFDDGDKIDVSARGVKIPPGRGSLEKLDGFDEVKISLQSSAIGPFTTDRMLLSRPESADLYELAFRGSTTAADLSDFALQGLPAALSAAITALVGSTRLGSGSIPVRLDASLASENGTARLVRGGGTVAGLPLGGIALSIVGAVVSRVTS
jgi:hypothetical protein